LSSAPDGPPNQLRLLDGQSLHLPTMIRASFDRAGEGAGTSGTSQGLAGGGPSNTSAARVASAIPVSNTSPIVASVSASTPVSISAAPASKRETADSGVADATGVAVGVGYAGSLLVEPTKATTARHQPHGKQEGQPHGSGRLDDRGCSSIWHSIGHGEPFHEIPARSSSRVSPERSLRSSVLRR
jgi:hypothetical protein